MIWSYSNGAGKTVSVNEKTRITVPEDRYGLYAIDTLDPDMVRHYFFGSFFVVLLFFKIVSPQSVAACRSKCLWCLFNFLSLSSWLSSCAAQFLVIIAMLLIIFSLSVVGFRLITVSAISETGTLKPLDYRFDPSPNKLLWFSDLIIDYILVTDHRRWDCVLLSWHDSGND